MVLSPGITGLLVASVLLSGTVAGAAMIGVAQAVRWNDDQLDELQLCRERRSLLVEIVAGVCLPAYALTLVLWVVTVDRIHPLFTGAMCAMGTINASRFGVSALGGKVLAATACCLWLVLHRATSVSVPGRAILRLKMALLVIIAMSLVADTGLQIRFFRDLRPDVITSCCAISFDEQRAGLGAAVASAPAVPSTVAFFAIFGMTAGAGWRHLKLHRSPILFSGLTVVLSFVSVVGILAWIAPAFYELPTHHCPFCLLAPRIGVAGYLLYTALIGGAVCGLASGLVHLLRKLDTLSCVRTNEESRLCRRSLIGFCVFMVIAVWPLMTTEFRLTG